MSFFSEPMLLTHVTDFWALTIYLLMGCLQNHQKLLEAYLIFSLLLAHLFSNILCDFSAFIWWLTKITSNWRIENEDLIIADGYFRALGYHLMLVLLSVIEGHQREGCITGIKTMRGSWRWHFCPLKRESQRLWGCIVMASRLTLSTKTKQK